MISASTKKKEESMIFISVLLTLNMSCATSISPEKLKLELRVPDGPIFAGEIVYLEARLKNVSTTPISIPIEGNDTGNFNYDIRVYDSDKVYSLCTWGARGIEHDILLNPGEEILFRKPLHVCTKRDFSEDKGFRVKAGYGWKEGHAGNLIESEEKWIDVRAPKTKEDKDAYHLLYTYSRNREKDIPIPDAYSGLSAYREIPQKYPTSLYVKYALFSQGKSEIELGTSVYFQKGIETLESLLREHPVFHLTDETLYYLGLAHQKLGEKEKALEIYKKVVKEFPGTEGAEIASKALQSLNSSK